MSYSLKTACPHSKPRLCVQSINDAARAKEAHQFGLTDAAHHFGGLVVARAQDCFGLARHVQRILRLGDGAFGARQRAALATAAAAAQRVARLSLAVAHLATENHRKETSNEHSNTER